MGERLAVLAGVRPWWPLVEPTSRWVRVRIGDEQIADSRRALLHVQYGPGALPRSFLPTYYVPMVDVVPGVLVDPVEDGDGLTVWAVQTAAQRVDDAAWMHSSPVEPLQALYDIDHRAKRDQEALAWLRQIARLDQHDRKAYRLLLERLVETKQFAEAKAVGEAALFVDVENPAIHSLYATALAETGDRKKAVFELESGLACNPPAEQAAQLHARLAAQYLALGNRDKARAERAEALRIDPKNAEAKALAIP